MQGILNGVDGCCVRGENANFLLGLYEAYRSIGIAKEMGEHALLPTHPWYGGHSFDEQKFISSARKIFNEQLAFPYGTKLAGFKEIRWSKSELRNNTIKEYMNFLDTLLKGVKIVFLTRNIKDIFESQIRADFDHTGINFEHFVEGAENFYSEIRSVSIPVFEIDYDDITHISAKMNKMFDFLEVEFDIKKINLIISTKHSYANARKIGTNKQNT